MNNISFHFIVKSFNFSRYIVDYLNSLKYQINTYSNNYSIYLTLVDDFSNDDTVAIAKEWISNESHLFEKTDLVINPSNFGISKTQIIATKLIRSDLFHIMDGDDVYNYLNIFQFIMNANKFDFYFSPIITFNKNNYKFKSFLRTLMPFYYFYESKDKTSLLKLFNPLPNPGSRISKNILMRRLYIIETNSDVLEIERFLVGGDLISWIDAFANEELTKGFAFEPYVLYRFGSGVSTNREVRNRSFQLDLSLLGFGVVLRKRTLNNFILRIKLKFGQFKLIIKNFHRQLPFAFKELYLINKLSRNHLSTIRFMSNNDVESVDL